MNTLNATRRAARTSAPPVPAAALPGLWQEDGGNDRLVRLSVPAVTPGMVMVARCGEDWQHRPELRWATWPDLLRPVRAL